MSKGSDMYPGAANLQKYSIRSIIGHPKSRKDAVEDHSTAKDLQDCIFIK
jgi:hypothetical protein